MSGGKRVRHTRRNGLRFALTVVALAAVVALLGWWGVRLLTHDDGVVPTADGPDSGQTRATGDSSGASAGDKSAGSSGDGGSGESDVASALDQCASELDAVEGAVRAARPGITSWSRHVQARTDMLAHRISERRMEAIYTRTKHLGHAAQPQFADALGAVDQPKPCTQLQGVGSSSDQRVTDCRERGQTAGAALTAAEAAMTEWKAHLKHMASYADGGMSSGKAMALWVAAWRKAPHAIHTYHHRVSALAAAPSCPPA